MAILPSTQDPGRQQTPRSQPKLSPVISCDPGLFQAFHWGGGREDHGTVQLGAPPGHQGQATWVSNREDRRTFHGGGQCRKERTSGPVSGSNAEGTFSANPSPTIRGSQVGNRLPPGAQTISGEQTQTRG